MAYYMTKHFGITASVDAVSRESAEAQLQWLLNEKSCFCYNCRETYFTDYSVRLRSGYEDDTVCTKDQSITSNTRLV